MNKPMIERFEANISRRVKQGAVTRNQHIAKVVFDRNLSGPALTEQMNNLYRGFSISDGYDISINGIPPVVSYRYC